MEIATQAAPNLFWSCQTKTGIRESLVKSTYMGLQ